MEMSGKYQGNIREKYFPNSGDNLIAFHWICTSKSNADKECF